MSSPLNMFEYLFSKEMARADWRVNEKQTGCEFEAWSRWEYARAYAHMPIRLHGEWAREIAVIPDASRAVVPGNGGIESPATS